jgi:hypothetical protein
MTRVPFVRSKHGFQVLPTTPSVRAQNADPDTTFHELMAAVAGHVAGSYPTDGVPNFGTAELTTAQVNAPYAGALNPTQTYLHEGSDDQVTVNKPSAKVAVRQPDVPARQVRKRLPGAGKARLQRPSLPTSDGKRSGGRATGRGQAASSYTAKKSVASAR